jgi:hypothetical protein
VAAAFGSNFFYNRKAGVRRPFLLRVRRSFDAKSTARESYTGEKRIKGEFSRQNEKKKRFDRVTVL